MVVGTVPRVRGDVIHRTTFSRMSAGIRMVGVVASPRDQRGDA